MTHNMVESHGNFNETKFDGVNFIARFRNVPEFSPF